MNRAIRTASRTVVPASAVLIAAGLLGACASDPGAAAAPSGPAASAVPASAAASPVASIVNEPAARKDVALTACARSAEGWAAAGTVTNAQQQAAGYTVVVSFTDKHSTVLARETATLQVAPGERQDWKVAARFTAPADVVCVLRGVDRA